MPTKVFLDTNILKFSATKLERLIPVNRKIRNWRGRIIGVQFYELGYINPNERIQNPELRREADLLHQVAELAKRGEFELLMHRETMYESWGLPNMNSVTGMFYDAPITDAETPIRYGRALFYPGFSSDDLT